MPTGRRYRKTSPAIKKNTQSANTSKTMSTTKDVVKRVKANMPKSNTNMATAMTKAANITGMNLPTSAKQLKNTKTAKTITSNIRKKAEKVVKNYKNKKG